MEFGIRGGIIEEIPEGHGLSDEQLAARMQAAEFDPTPGQTLEEYTEESTEDFGPMLSEKYGEVQLEELKSQRDAARRQAQEAARRHSQEAARRHSQEAERRKQGDLEELRRQLRAADISAEARKQELARARAPRITVATYDPFQYRRLYDWGITVIPQTLDFYKRRELEDVISDLIKQDLIRRKSVTSIEEKIRALLETDSFAKKKPARPTKKKPTKKKSTKKKSTKKKPAKKKPAKKKPAKKKSTKKNPAKKK